MKHITFILVFAAMILYPSCKSSKMPVDALQKEILDVQKNEQKPAIQKLQVFPHLKLAEDQVGWRK